MFMSNSLNASFNFHEMQSNYYTFKLWNFSQILFSYSNYSFTNKIFYRATINFIALNLKFIFNCFHIQSLFSPEKPLMSERCKVHEGFMNDNIIMNGFQRSFRMVIYIFYCNISMEGWNPT